MSLPVITLMGATASGKTRLAMALYTKRPDLYDVINVDSALIYQGMDIGTAKPTVEQLQQVPHALVNILDPTETYSVGQFKTDVAKLIQDSHNKGKIPLLVGGTMMYYRSLLGELDYLPSSSNQSRAWVLELQQKYGDNFCHDLLYTIDNIAYTRLHPNDRQRVGRILEIWYLTGKATSAISNNNSSLSKSLKPLEKTQRMRAINKQLFNSPHYNLEDYYIDFHQLKVENCLAKQNEEGNYLYFDTKGKTLVSSYNLLQFTMYNQDRDVLHQDIAKRLDSMLQDGLVDEVAKLYQRGDLSLDFPSIRCVGYRQLWEYFEGKVDLATATDKIIFATRQLAKRQITWLRSWPQPFIQIPTNISLEYQIKIIEKVLGLALFQIQDPRFDKFKLDLS